ncbi:hypothetical protein GHR37_29250 [Achromobacter xylosoxidans]|nr:hypothetical protein [Achromobacter xylosoxidans]
MRSSSITRDHVGTRLTTADHAGEARVVRQAISLLEKRLYPSGPSLSTPEAAHDYLQLQLMKEPSEVFAVVFLTTQHQVIACEILFRGTIDGVDVHPRVVAQRALVHNAAAILVAHYVARNIMRVMCPVFLCGRALETWHTAMVSKHWLGT